MSYVTPQNQGTVEVLVEIAERQGVQPGAVAIAWLASRQNVIGALASARTVIQLEGLLESADVELTADDLASLELVSTPLD